MLRELLAHYYQTHCRYYYLTLDFPNWALDLDPGLEQEQEYFQRHRNLRRFYRIDTYSDIHRTFHTAPALHIQNILSSLHLCNMDNIQSIHHFHIPLWRHHHV